MTYQTLSRRPPAGPWLQTVLSVLLLFSVLVAGCQPLVTKQAGPSLHVQPTLAPTVILPAPASPAAESLPTAVDSAAPPGEAAWALEACQSCHGAFAEGGIGPPLRGTDRAPAAFRAWVRDGSAGDTAPSGAGMRGYGQEELDDQQVSAIHAWLQGLPATLPTPMPNPYGLKVPPQMRVTRLAGELDYPSAVAIGQDGSVWVATLGAPLGSEDGASGRIWRLVDQDRDCEAETRHVVAEGLRDPLGLLWLEAGPAGPLLLVAIQSGVLAVDLTQDNSQPWLLVDRLPGLDSFQVTSLAQGPDNFLYIGQGPPLRPPAEDPPLPGAVWRIDLQFLGTEPRPELFVSGLRTPLGLVFSASGAVFAVDSGLGWPLRADVPDEVNLLLGGADLGWPDVWGTPQEGSGTIGPVAELPNAAGTAGALLYSGRLFTEYANDFFITLFGQDLPAGRTSPAAIQRVEVVSDVLGYHSYVHEFVSGLQRPFGLAEGPDGSIYVADHDAGSVYCFQR